MAKCDLSIELHEPDKYYPGGGKIRGVVRVDADKNVNCKGLEVKSVWRTHGRGNVATDQADSATLYSGPWQAGQQEEYPFELEIAEWPPSYHGGYLNVDHYIEARAKIPWGFDPKASAPFIMRPTKSPEEAGKAKNSIQFSGTAGCIAGSVFMGVFVLIFVAVVGAMGVLAVPFLAIPGILIGGLWFFLSVLPKWALGEVHCELDESVYAPGDEVTGMLTIRPKKGLKVNAITMTFSAQEVCVSGSGSNRTTHRNVFLEREQTLLGSSELKPGMLHEFPIQLALPADAPYSLDLPDNDLTWTTMLRVDIPRWPDWKKTLNMCVAPSGNPLPETSQPRETDSAPPSPSEGGITFAETAEHLWSVREDVDQIDALVDAVSGLSMNLEAFVERRLLYSGSEDPHVFDDGYAVWAKHSDPPLPLVLYVPHHLADEFEQAGRDLWTGRGTIVGWDHEHRRLQVKLES